MTALRGAKRISSATSTAAKSAPFTRLRHNRSLLYRRRLRLRSCDRDRLPVPGTNKSSHRIPPSPTRPVAAGTNFLGSPGSASNAELIDENDRLKTDKVHLTHELAQMKSLCNNIMDLMSKYASGRQENSCGGGGGRGLLDLMPQTETVIAEATRFSGESELAYATGDGGGSWRSEDEVMMEVKTEAEVMETASPTRLFGVPIGMKRTREEATQMQMQMEEEIGEGNCRRSEGEPEINWGPSDPSL
ncbi:Heat stress transcription factor B-2a [Acorus calamus]|uniref:Heat stress transcription factor B-2a n=1 Tax=Acorus calamus TaxID=4465 RepID=A0AAV9DYC3_ACOCL|nr:Heat stress transcription factor B-2a [Acorus calamus]